MRKKTLCLSLAALGLIVCSKLCVGATSQSPGAGGGVKYSSGIIAEVNNENLVTHLGPWYEVTDTWPTPEYILTYIKTTVSPIDSHGVGSYTVFESPPAESGVDPDDRTPITSGGTTSQFHPDDAHVHWGFLSLFLDFSHNCDLATAKNFYGFEMGLVQDWQRDIWEFATIQKWPHPTMLWPGEWELQVMTFAEGPDGQPLLDEQGSPVRYPTTMLTFSGEHWHKVTSTDFQEGLIVQWNDNLINEFVSWVVPENWAKAIDVIKGMTGLSSDEIMIGGIHVDPKSVKQHAYVKYWLVDCPMHNRDVKGGFLGFGKVRHTRLIRQVAVLYMEEMDGYITWHRKMNGSWQTAEEKTPVPLKRISSWQHPDLPVGLTGIQLPAIMFNGDYRRIFDLFFQDNNHLRGLAAHMGGGLCSCWTPVEEFMVGD